MQLTGQRHTGPTCDVEPGTTSLCGLMVGVGMSLAFALSGKTNVYEATVRVPTHIHVVLRVTHIRVVLCLG